MNNKKIDIEEQIKIAKIYKVDFNYGLTNEQVLERKKNNLINHYKKKKKSYLNIIKKNVFNILNLVLFSCGIFIFLLGLYRRLFFLFSVFFNTIINLFRDIKLQFILNSLTFEKQKKTKVIRNGETKDVFFDDVVLSDIVVLEEGSVVPSDAKIVEGKVYVDESFLTGEKAYVLKQKGDLIYKETLVIDGFCKIEIVKVGFANYICKLENELSSFKKMKGTIFLKMVKFLKGIFSIIFLIVLVEFLIMILKQAICVNVLDSIISSLLSMISTGVFLLFSFVLILWSVKMTKKGILVNEIFSIENLVSIDILCLDKTGTITNGNMEYEKIIPFESNNEQDLENILSFFLYDNEKKDNLTLKAIRKKINKNNNDLKIKKYINFNSKNKFSAVFVNDYVYVLGATNFINVINEEIVKKTVNEYEKKGYRVLILSKSKYIDSESKKIPDNLKVIGIVLFSEVINDNVKKTFEYLKKNKIKINIISGDSEEYLRYILQKIDFDNYKIANLNKLDNNEIKKIIMDDYNVFSRATPDQKKIIIEELKTNNKVAMIGDGINDLLALKTADCSISMPNGHDITKKISNFVLLNSNFKNLIFLIEESKTVIKNIQSMYSLFFTKMMSMILLSFFYIFISLFFGNFFPLNINNLFPWEIITSGIGTVLISFDKFVENKKIDINNFIFNILKYSILSAFLQILIFFSSFLIHLFMPNILTFKGFISLSVLMISFSSIFIMYFLCYQPLNKTRFFILFFLTFLMSFFFIVDYFIFKKNNFSIIDIFYNEINLKSFLILFVIVLFLFFIYSLFVKYLKKKESFNRNKK